MTESSNVFEFEGGTVEPGETKQFRFPVSETYLGEEIRLPVTIVNGEKPGTRCFLTAASHGDELNGIEVVREVVEEWEHNEICGTLVGIPVMNVPGFLAQQRYLPGSERDLNRSFPGKEGSTDANRIAHKIYTNFIEPCDIGVDFHTSTRGRTNMFHVRADMDQDKTARLARAFGSNVIIGGEGSEGMLRTEALKDDIPAITVEMGEAHRFERGLINNALEGIRSVFAEYGIYETEVVRNPIWREIIEGWSERTWIRADDGGIIDMNYNRGALIYEGETIGTVTSPFKKDTDDITAPFTGLLVGVLENPVVNPGDPLCHFAKLDEQTIGIIETLN